MCSLILKSPQQVLPKLPDLADDHAQAISILRAKLSGGYVAGNALATNDQNILQTDNMTPNLVPSNGYTFPRTPAQVSRQCPSDFTHPAHCGMPQLTCVASGCRGHALLMLTEDSGPCDARQFGFCYLDSTNAINGDKADIKLGMS